ncbi:MAG: serine/threonine protein kinase [Kofleriaceae bacterium]|jgi:serine/threonine protein kinase|nr:serine/threonine protein kinase [Kofleriaceae bacterium]MBP6835734.1 serine/threonine protein kinase [Kofleriaceae bacterium]MBP9205097.1 serine/threonine protein kinase [Kofleriaceae bacterium]
MASDGAAGDGADPFAQTIAPPPGSGRSEASAAGAAATPTGIGADATLPPDKPVGTPSRVIVGSIKPRGGDGRDAQRSLSADLGAGETLDAAAPGGSADLSTLPEVPPEHYEPDREVARGGMGRILAARDRRLGRPVAIKELLELGAESGLRFRREALITARLQHPGIIPVYEAGRWPSGEPFFAMKLVTGRPLDKVIGDAKDLPSRLALLPRILAATEAIAYAHSQRVIHRDLKPGNILVGEFGETVVIDWGLAKDLDATDGDTATPATRAPAPGRAAAAGARAAAAAADASTDDTTARRRERTTTTTSDASTLTVVGAVMGTPAYMAPEQARGEPLDERADVFALGAMLYHLLSGSPPYAAKTATDVLAAAALGRIKPLAERAPDAPADLVTIVGRAMAPELADRYRDAGALAEELRRYLTGQLVGAHRYTARERVVRFVRKHRAAVTIAAIAVAGFAVGGTLAVRRIVVERDRAELQRTIAVARKQAAERLVDFMQQDLHSRLEPIGRLDLLSGLGSEVRHYYDVLEVVPGGMVAADVDRMAKALRLLAHVERQQGNLDAAVATWKEARAKVEALLVKDRDSPASFDRRLLLALTDVDLGSALQARGKIDESAALYRSANGALDALLVERPTHREALLGSGEAHDRLGDLLRNQGKVDEGIEEYTAARLARDRVVAGGQGQGDRQAVFALSTSHMKLGSAHYARGESPQALAAYQACARLRDTLAEGDPDNPEWQRGQLQVAILIADLHRELGNPQAAVTAYQEILPTADALVRRDPANTEWRRNRGNLLSDLAFARMDLGKYDTALAGYRDAMDNHRELIARDPQNASWQIDLSRMYARTGDAYYSLGDYRAALAAYDEAKAIRQALTERDPKNSVWRRSYAWSLIKVAQVYVIRREAGDLDNARSLHERALTLRQELSGQSPNHAGLRNELSSSEITLGKLLLEHGDGDADASRGRQLLEHGVAQAQALVDGDSSNTEWKETLAGGLIALGKLDLGRRDLVAGRATLTRAAALTEGVVAQMGSSPLWQGTRAEVLEALAAIDAAEGKAADAAERRRQAYAALAALDVDGRLPVFRRALMQRLRAYK